MRADKATKTYNDLSRDEHLTHTSLTSCPGAIGAAPENPGPRPLPGVTPDLTTGYMVSRDGPDDQTERIDDMAGSKDGHRGRALHHEAYRAGYRDGHKDGRDGGHEKPVKHVGFGGAVASVMKKEGYSKERAARIIGAGKAHASAAARERNPRLNRTGGRKSGRGR